MNRRTLFLFAIFGAVCVGGGFLIAQSQQSVPPSLVDYEGFEKLTEDVESYRKTRLVDLDTWLEMAEDENTIILDTRSQGGYNRKHIKGAEHLNFSDFADEKLAKVIPSKDTRILIYCNNNIGGDPAEFMMKAPPLALNVPTFINLVGYGYTNVYELSELVQADDPRIEFEGTMLDLDVLPALQTSR